MALQGLLHITDFKGSPFLANLVPAASAALAPQILIGAIGVARQSETFYDLAGGVSHLLTLAASIFVPKLRTRLAASSGKHNESILDILRECIRECNWRQLAVTGGVSLWSIRLATFLFLRVLRAGKDSRFNHVRHRPRRFFTFWLVQALWVLLCNIPVIAINAVPSTTLNALPKVTAFDVTGFSLFVLGGVVEMVADHQKSAWSDEKRRKLHDELFITRGIWGRSRYPNYFGDITLWTGIATVAAGVLVREPVQKALGWNDNVTGLLKAVSLPLVSPAFVSWALLKLSGVPMSQAKYDRLYGDRKDYQEWRNNTPFLIPRIF